MKSTVVDREIRQNCLYSLLLASRLLRSQGVAQAKPLFQDLKNKQA